MVQGSSHQQSRPPELFWNLRKVLLATLVFGLFGFFLGWIVFYIMTFGFNAKEKEATTWLYGIPIGMTAFALVTTLLFARQERRRLLDFYRKED